MGQYYRRTPLWWCLLIAVWLLIGTRVVYAEPLDTEASASKNETSQSLTAEPLTLYKKISNAVDVTIGLSTGLRFDELNWSIAGASGSGPNILSELEWDQVFSHQLTLSGTLEANRRFYLRGHGNIAWIQSGSVRDSDYDGDDRTQEYSRSISETNGDELFDLVAGAGYPFHLMEDRIFIAPLLGVSYHVQNFRITNGEQVVSDPSHSPSPPAIGPLDSRLNSSYSARWFGAWAGFDVRYLMETGAETIPPITWDLSLMYHFWGDYSAEADWNLRGDLAHPKSFEHEADGKGISLTAKCQVPINHWLGIHLIANYTRWTTDEGTATIYPANTTIAPQVTQLNEVEWETHSVMIGVECLFF